MVQLCSFRSVPIHPAAPTTVATVNNATNAYIIIDRDHGAYPKNPRKWIGRCRTTPRKHHSMQYYRNCDLVSSDVIRQKTKRRKTHSRVIGPTESSNFLRPCTESMDWLIVFSFQHPALTKTTVMLLAERIGTKVNSVWRGSISTHPLRTWYCKILHTFGKQKTKVSLTNSFSSLPKVL